MRASFLISRKQPWMGQLLLMARNKALTLLLKLYRRTPIFRPRHLPGTNRTQSGGTIRDRTIWPSGKNTNLPCRFPQLTMFGDLVHLDVLREDDFLNEDSDVEFGADGEVLLDMHSRRRQGNFELALMAGGQLDVDSEEDEEYDEWDCEGCVREMPLNLIGKHKRVGFKKLSQKLRSDVGCPGIKASATQRHPPTPTVWGSGWLSSGYADNCTAHILMHASMYITAHMYRAEFKPVVAVAVVVVA
ncbi:uncharacterized protein LOC122616464 isoform X3 [Drosophila teissieri]|uniref:uncharacterized protein LOC122616464 isoform X3 n=1 Tax=Drosophila teissieri TaxID=7243 RepID=UPI001CBA0D49|nr:uncharacterized protein LOC122616464 isoform X3 [Drosophila teissieri]